MATTNAAPPQSLLEANTFSQSVTSKENNKEKANSNGHNRDNFRRLTQSHLQEKIRKGECFHYKEKCELCLQEQTSLHHDLNRRA